MTNKLYFIYALNNEAIIQNILNELLSCKEENTKILVIDDNSQDKTAEIIKEIPEISLIVHHKTLGYGAALVNALEFAQDFEIEQTFSLDINYSKITTHLNKLEEELNKGLDFVNCAIKPEDQKYYSRIISENNNQILTKKINNISHLNWQAPFSLFKGIKNSAISNFQLTEYAAGVMFQLALQTQFYGLSSTEIISDEKFSPEMKEFSNDKRILSRLLSALETEMYLYPLSITN